MLLDFLDSVELCLLGYVCDFTCFVNDHVSLLLMIKLRQFK